MECSAVRRVCLFIEAFDDDEVYEQLLSHYDGCVKVESNEDAFHSFSDDDAMYFEEVAYDTFKVDMPRVMIGTKYSSGKNEEFNITFVISHNCASDREVRCLRQTMDYNALYKATAISVNGNLADAGELGACSNRWIGSRLWERVENDKLKFRGK